MSKPRGENLDWNFILAEGAKIVNSYSTAVTLRQLHYRLVAANIGGYENTISRYTKLASKTAEARRDGWFPELIDPTRQIEEEESWECISDALRDLAGWYRSDRSIGQKHQVWCLFEKATLTQQINSWVNAYGIRRGATRGYSSQPLQQSIWDAMNEDGRPVVVFYIGDLDPEGEDAERNLRARAEEAGIQISHWQRLGVTPEQITRLNLVPRPGKVDSKRAKSFIAKHGNLFQVEVEAIDPAALQRLITRAVFAKRWWDRDAWEAAVAAEDAGRERLRELADEEEEA